MRPLQWRLRCSLGDVHIKAPICAQWVAFARLLFLTSLFLTLCGGGDGDGDGGGGGFSVLAAGISSGESERRRKREREKRKSKQERCEWFASISVALRTLYDIDMSSMECGPEESVPMK